MDPTRIILLQNELTNIFRLSRNLEKLLCNGMDWLLHHLGYVNVAIWLSKDDYDEEFEFSAYMKYTVESNEVVLQRLLDEHILRSRPRDNGQSCFFKIHFGEQCANWVRKGGLHNHELVATRCYYLDECLAVICVSRPVANPSLFSKECIEILKIFNVFFPIALASMYRGDAGDTDNIPENPEPKRKQDPADWWKNGDPPPY